MPCISCTAESTQVSCHLQWEKESPSLPISVNLSTSGHSQDVQPTAQIYQKEELLNSFPSSLSLQSSSRAAGYPNPIRVHPHHGISLGTHQNNELDVEK